MPSLRSAALAGIILFLACTGLSVLYHIRHIDHPHQGQGGQQQQEQEWQDTPSSTYVTLESAQSPRCSLSGKECLLAPSLRDATAQKTRNPQSCPKNSFHFFGTCPCFPGYTGAECDEVLPVANVWYTAYCPNLEATRKGGSTYSAATPVEELGGEFYSFGGGGGGGKSGNACAPMKKQPACAYLCYSHPSYGAAAVPESLWRTAQRAEAALGRSWGGAGSPTHDRAEEHWRGFNNFACVPSTKLGRVIEVGAGPWTQLKGMLHVRPDLQVDEFTVFEPGADGYVKNVQSCSYRTGRLETWAGVAPSHHAFPVVVRSSGGELLLQGAEAYDTLVSINVLEHVQDAFNYLQGLHSALRPGGLLVFHERFYDDAAVVQGDEYHPVRVKRAVIDTFLAAFDVVFNNCQHDYDGRPGEVGYYVVARKR